MKPIFWALGAAAIFACKQKDSHPVDTQLDAGRMNAEMWAMV